MSGVGYGETNAIIAIRFHMASATIFVDVSGGIEASKMEEISDTIPSQS